MAQHDYSIANQSGAAFRADLNNALQAIVSNNSGAAAPSTTYAHQVWIDTSTSPATIKRRDAANAAWISIGLVDGTVDVSVGSAATPSVRFIGDPNTGLFTPAADTVAISTGGTERMRVAATNSVTFFSSAISLAPESITLSGAATAEELVVTKTGVDTFRFGVDVSGPRITSGGPTRVIAGGSGGVSLAAGATAWAAISDERHKTNLQPITDGLDKVDTLRAVTGRYKTDNEDVSRSFLIAQDVQAVLPEAVDNSNEEQLSLRYSEIIPLLVAALKESKERIEQLEVAVTALQQS